MYKLLFIPLALALIQYFDIHKLKFITNQREILRSFSAGFSVAYVFLLLFPELPALGIQTHVDTALYTLIGFTIFHEAHKLVFTTKNTTKKNLYLQDVHLITAGFYHFLVTFFLVEISKRDIIQGVIVTAIIATHMILSEISQIDTKIHSKKKTLSITALILGGGILALLDVLDRSSTTAMFAATAGAIAYIAIREEIPQDNKVKPFYFLNGILVVIILESVLL